MKRHTKLAPHACTLCDKRYWKKHTLANHMHLHAGIRPYVCDLCGADFAYDAALYLHKRLKHKIAKGDCGNNAYNVGASVDVWKKRI